MSLFVHNTASRRKEEFRPIDPANVRIYACGPTVYDLAHVGNARMVVVFDLIVRVLRDLFPKVTYVRNITDVDDKINAAARERGVPIDTITAQTTAAFHADMAALQALPPDVEPRATHHILEMIALIRRLIDLGHAYEAQGHVLFNVPSMAAYGALSGRDRDEQIAGARVEVAPFKRDAADFVLWKPSDADLPGWDSPWGRGRPGWHIECSAMAEAYLGETFDIHGGGQDLLFPHHENEVAQSTCAHGGARLANYWLHNGMVAVDGRKMSKSLGNVVVVRDALKAWPGEVVRWTLLSAHYRQPLDWTENALSQARANLDRAYTALRRLASVAPEPPGDLLDPVRSALRDDFNTPQAMAALLALCSRANKSEAPAEQAHLRGAIEAGGRLMGLLEQDAEAWFHSGPGSDAAWIESMIAARAAARAAKDFAKSDRIRDELAAKGILLEDGSGGTIWRRAG